jgi:glucosyl-dolichyl phosphate glucuronosyltransferase
MQQRSAKSAAPAPEVTVVISTYNRCHLLLAAIEGVLNQDPGAPSCEIVVVDNNSTDDTKRIVESEVRRVGSRLRYIFEGKQGIAHGRNSGVAAARAPIIAFTDDDVRVSRTWLSTAKRALDMDPTIDFVGGKVLPLWPSPPPLWLDREHWGPLALTDFGDENFYVNAARRTCLVSANIAFRRHVFEQFGGFDPAFQHNGGSVSSAEDHEFEERLWNAGRQGLYLPTMVVEADVQPNRLTKAYHRRWHADHGRVIAPLVLSSHGVTGSPNPTLLGVPLWVLRQAATNAAAMLRDRVLGRDGSAFLHEGALRERIAWIRYSRSSRHKSTSRAAGRDIHVP